MYNHIWFTIIRYNYNRSHVEGYKHILLQFSDDAIQLHMGLKLQMRPKNRPAVSQSIGPNPQRASSLNQAHS